MSTKKNIQLVCTPGLYDKIYTYKEQKNYATDARAVRELVEFALKAIEFSEQKDDVSSRDILEKILNVVVESNLLNQHALFNVVHHTMRCDISQKEVVEDKTSQAIKAKHKSKSKEYCRDFLEGKVKDKK